MVQSTARNFTILCWRKCSRIFTGSPKTFFLTMFLDEDGMSSNLMTVEDFARILRVTERTVYRWIKAGKVSAVRKDGQTLVSVKELDRIKSRACELMRMYGISVSTYKRWMKDVRKNYPHLLEKSNPLHHYIILRGKYDAFVHWLTYLTPKTFSIREIFDAYAREYYLVYRRPVEFAQIYVEHLRKAVKKLVKSGVLIRVRARYFHSRYLRANAT